MRDSREFWEERGSFRAFYLLCTRPRKLDEAMIKKILDFVVIRAFTIWFDHLLLDQRGVVSLDSHSNAQVAVRNTSVNMKRKLEWIDEIMNRRTRIGTDCLVIALVGFFVFAPVVKGWTMPFPLY